MILIISIQSMLKSYSEITKNVKKHFKESVVNNESINNKETVCDRCKRILNKITAPSAGKNYHNKHQIKHQTFHDESFQRCVDNSENELLSSSDDDQNFIRPFSTHELISYDKQSENTKILEVCHTTNTVSMLRKQFENFGGKKNNRSIEKHINEKFFKKKTSPINVNENVDFQNFENEDIKSGVQPNNDYYVIEKTKVYKVVNNNKEHVKDKDSVDKISKLILSKRSNSSGDIKRIKRSSSHDIIAEEPIFSTNVRNNHIFDNIEYRKTTAANNRSTVRTFDDILQQERFSRCYSEYSISDLLSDLPDDDDREFASFFNKI